MLSTTALSTRAELRDAPIPDRLPGHEEGRSYPWEPIPHLDLVEALGCALSVRGFHVKGERLALCRKGLGLIGAFDLQAPAGLRWNEGLLPGGLTPSLGFRHSNDAKWAATIAVGARVEVCDNGLISGTHVLKRQHRGADLEALAGEAVDTWQEGARDAATALGSFSEIKIPTALGDALFCAGAHRGAWPWRFVSWSSKVWHSPPQPEFEPRTLWSWFNAATEAIKRRQPEAQFDGLGALFEFATLIATEGPRVALQSANPNDN